LIFAVFGVEIVEKRDIANRFWYPCITSAARFGAKDRLEAAGRATIWFDVSTLKDLKSFYSDLSNPWRTVNSAAVLATS